MTALEENKLKILAVDCLKAMKEQKTFRVLSRELALPAGVLNRYIHGYVLPKADRADKIITYFTKGYLGKLLDSARPVIEVFFSTGKLSPVTMA